MSIMENGIPVAVPEVVYRDNSRVGMKTESFSVTLDYTNYTKSSIYVKTQNNIAFVVAPNNNTINASGSGPHLEIKITYSLVSGNNIHDTLELLRALGANGGLSPDAKFVYDHLMKLYEADPTARNKSNFKVSIMRRITEDSIRSHQVTYVKEADIIVSFEKAAMQPPHPNSSEGLQQIDYKKEYIGQAGLFVRVVDNENLADVRYYHAGKRLISVPSVTDPTKQSGVYVTESTRAPDGLLTPKSIFLTFDEATEHIGLYRTQEEALSNGNPELILQMEDSRSKKEERRLALELQAVKHQSALDTARAEKEALELKRALEISKAETLSLKESTDFRKLIRDDAYADKEKRRSDKANKRKDKYESRGYRRKDRYEDRGYHRKDYYEDRGFERKQYYEDRSMDRKDTSELIKFVPGLLVGVLGAFAFMRSSS